jgi:single-stranded-DNA-specific exonuclease
MFSLCLKFGLNDLNETRRPGLIALFRMAKIMTGNVGTHEVGFMIAPRLNSAGRMAHALDALRLICTKDPVRADSLAKSICKTNIKRQKVVGQLMTDALERASEIEEKVIVLASEDYHEGVIGLAASKLVAHFYRPVIVMSINGEMVKASARSVEGFNIIEAIRSVDQLVVESGGHPLAAGFSIMRDKIEDFTLAINKAASALTDPLTKILKADMEVDFDLLTWDLSEALKVFDPVGNPAVVFVTCAVNIKDARVVGAENKHLKMRLESGGQEFGAIAFGFGERLGDLDPQVPVNIAYTLEENVWNGKRSLELKIRDIK